MEHQKPNDIFRVLLTTREALKQKLTTNPHRILRNSSEVNYAYYRQHVRRIHASHSPSQEAASNFQKNQNSQVLSSFSELRMRGQTRSTRAVSKEKLDHFPDLQISACTNTVTKNIILSQSKPTKRTAIPATPLLKNLGEKLNNLNLNQNNQPSETRRERCSSVTTRILEPMQPYSRAAPTIVVESVPFVPIKLEENAFSNHNCISREEYAGSNDQGPSNVSKKSLNVQIEEAEVVEYPLELVSSLERRIHRSLKRFEKTSSLRETPVNGQERPEVMANLIVEDQKPPIFPKRPTSVLAARVSRGENIKTKEILTPRTPAPVNNGTPKLIRHSKPQSLGALLPKSQLFSRQGKIQSEELSKNLNLLKNEDKGKKLRNVSAKSWVLYSTTRGFLAGKNENEGREIASLTKIMTCYACLQLAKALNLDLALEKAKVSKFAASVIGTSAHLRAGDQLSLTDLLYGLMLPSGNDAATVLAEYFGKILFKSSLEYKEQLDQGASEEQVQCIRPTRFFIREMNRVAKELQLKETIYANAHGLPNKLNTSTARDQALLCLAALKNKQFKQIVQTKKHTVKVENEGLETRVLEWKNTNLILDRGYDGVKTGTTSTAGACLASSLTRNEQTVICILLNSKSTDTRWIEAIKLIDYGFEIE